MSDTISVQILKSGEILIDIFQNVTYIDFMHGPSGPAGPQGEQGEAGADGYSGGVIGEFRASNTTTPTPTAGQVRWDNATQISANNLLISHETFGNTDIDFIFLTLQVGEKIYIQDKDDATNYQIWEVTGAPTGSHASAYWTIPVTLESSNGTGTTNFPNNHNILVAVKSTGTQGPAGPSLWGGISGDIRTQIDLMQEFRFHIRMPGWRHLNAIGHDGEFGVLGRSFLDVTGTSAFNDNFSRWALVVPDFSKQITGVRWWQTVQGTSTTADRNGVAIYEGSIGSSVVNLVAETPEVGMSFWINPANTIVTKLFNTPVTLTPFTIYYVVGVFCCDVLNTAPSLGIIAGTQGNPLTSFAHTNGHRAAFTRLLASTPATVDISVSAATTNAVMFFELF